MGPAVSRGLPARSDHSRSRRSARMSHHMEPPTIVELRVHVGVERTLGRQPIERPVFPVIEVPPKLPKDSIGLSERQVGPAGPSLLVGLPQKSDIVDVKAWCAPLVGGLEAEPLAPDLGESHLEIAAGQRRPGRIERRRPVGTLVQVNRILLCLRDRRGTSRNTTQVERPRHLVSPPESPTRVDTGGVRTPWRCGSLVGSSDRFTAVTMNPTLPFPPA